MPGWRGCSSRGRELFNRHPNHGVIPRPGGNPVRRGLLGSRLIASEYLITRLSTASLRTTAVLLRQRLARKVVMRPSWMRKFSTSIEAGATSQTPMQNSMAEKSIFCDTTSTLFSCARISQHHFSKPQHDSFVRAGDGSNSIIADAFIRDRGLIAPSLPLAQDFFER